MSSPCLRHSFDWAERAVYYLAIHPTFSLGVEFNHLLLLYIIYQHITESIMDLQLLLTCGLLISTVAWSSTVSTYEYLLTTGSRL
jgi:hypothetical protein